MTTLDPSMHAGQAPAFPARDRAMIVHDLRGALQGVLSAAAMLDAAQVGAEVQPQVDRVSASAQMLASLLNQVLDEEAPDPDGTPSAVDLPRFLGQLADRWNGEAQEHGGRFCIEADPGLPDGLRVDPTSLARALGHLIGNACAHGRSGDVRLGVRRTDDGGVAFEVVDYGPGVAQAIIDRVMRPGPTISGVGHGLGLHIARSLCAEIGGALSLDNRPSGGLVATIAIPGGLCEAGASASVTPAAPDRVDLRGMRVLLAEDNPTNQMVAVQMLRALNADVMLASDGVEALERFEAAEFDLVVVDIEMPRMSGLDVIRAIRGRSDDRAGVPIVALTAYVMRDHRERIAAAGANGLISKPITSVALLGQTLLEHAAAAAPPQAAQASSSAPPDGDEPVADLVIFDALCAAIGDSIMAELLEKVVADLMQCKADLAAALAPLDRKPIRAASHIVTSVAGAIGATRLQRCAQALYLAAHGEDGRTLPEDVRRCCDEIDAAVAFAEDRRAAG